jgi:hypothetical protein
MEPDLNDLIAQLPDDDTRDLVAGLALPPDYTLSRLIFEVVEGYYAAQKKLNETNGTSLEFVSPPTNSEVLETADGGYEITRKYILNGVIRLGIKSFQPLDLTPETSAE